MEKRFIDFEALRFIVKVGFYNMTFTFLVTLCLAPYAKIF